MAYRAGGGGRRVGKVKKGSSSGKLVLSPSEQWEVGSPNAPANIVVTREEKRLEIIEVLRSFGVTKLELVPVYNVPTFRQGQNPDVDPLNVEVCKRYTVMGDRRRDYLLLEIRTRGQETDQTKKEKKAIRRELDAYEDEVAELFIKINDARGIPVDVPEQFSDYPMYVPKK